MKATPHFDRFAADIFRCLYNSTNCAVEIFYSGSGDSGWFDDGWVVRIKGTMIGNHEIKRERHITGLLKSELDALKAVDAAWDENVLHNELAPILEDSAPGWENNCGGSGFFRISSDGMRTHTHNQYYEECDTTVEAF